MSKLLAKKCEVLLAVDGAECDSLLAQHGERVAMILVDLSLRNAEDGLAIVRRLRRDARWRDLPIIAVTAHAMEQDRENALRSGCSGYLSKPVDRRPLFETMERAWRRT